MTVTRWSGIGGQGWKPVSTDEQSHVKILNDDGYVTSSSTRNSVPEDRTHGLYTVATDDEDDDPGRRSRGGSDAVNESGNKKFNINDAAERGSSSKVRWGDEHEDEIKPNMKIKSEQLRPLKPSTTGYSVAVDNSPYSSEIIDVD